MHFLPEHALEDLTLAHFFRCLITLALSLKCFSLVHHRKTSHFLPPERLRMNLSQYQDNPSLETGTTFSAGTLGRRSGKDNTRTTGGIAPKAILMVWGHVRSNGHYHFMEAILVLDWMAPASPWQRRQGRWGTCQGCEKRWTLRGRLPRRRGWDLNRTLCHPNIRCIFETIQICVLTCLLWWSVCVFVCLSRKK